MRRRAARLHLPASQIASQVVGGRLGVRVVLTGVVGTTRRAAEDLADPVNLDFYDWEPNVITPSGKPAGPMDAAVTGGAEPGSASAGVPEYRAVLRAAKRAAVLPPSDSDLASYTPGCSAQENAATSGAKAGCLYGSWYLLDESNQSVLLGPFATRSGMYAAGPHIPAGATVKAVHVNPGTVLVQALPEEGLTGKERRRNSWYVLNDNPVLDGNDLTNPRQEFENSGSGAPDVAFEFTNHGREAFERVTKEIAKRGEDLALPGVPKQNTLQHFAIVLDDRLLTVPSIDWSEYPEGIDAKYGSEITGGFTLVSAQTLAAELQAGSLPLALELVSVRRIPSG